MNEFNHANVAIAAAPFMIPARKSPVAACLPAAAVSVASWRCCAAIVFSWPAIVSSPAAVARAATRLGYSNMPIVSGAGHDAVYMARLAPTGMIFIPCKGGISHNEIEYASPEHVTAGGNVLLHAVLERAGL